MPEALIEKIKSRGYWRVVVRPTQYKKDLISSLSECLRLTEESKVSLRGWDYPHIARRGEGLVNGDDWVESSTDWEPYIEHWRFYQSAQFVHLFNCREDWRDIDERGGPRRRSSLPESFLEPIWAVYRTTEIYEFAARLAAKSIFGNSLSISVELHNMKGRTLFLTDPSRGQLLGDYTCQIDDISFSKKTMSVEVLLAKSRELALENIVHLFERFTWDVDRIPMDVLKNDQRKLIERRL
jgi:hypothetical protein